jgi:hypothetical protein
VHASGCRWTDLGIGLTWPLVAPIRQSLQHLDDINGRPALDLLGRSRLHSSWPRCGGSPRRLRGHHSVTQKSTGRAQALQKMGKRSSLRSSPVSFTPRLPAPLQSRRDSCSGHSSWPSPGTVGRRIWLRRRSDPEAFRDSVSCHRLLLRVHGWRVSRSQPMVRTCEKEEYPSEGS